MRQGSHTDEPAWTLAEGVGDILRFLARRAPWALGLWLALAATLTAFTNLGSVAGAISAFTLLIAFLSAACGFVVGMVLSKGLLRAAGFVGWIPLGLALGASVLVVVGGALLLGLVLPVDHAFYGALMPIAAAIGALGAVLKFVWAAS